MKLRNVNVKYVKGKYSYKKAYSAIANKKGEIHYSGPIEPMEPVFAKIILLTRSLMEPGERLSNESRRSLKLLQDMMKDPTYYFKNEGITHIIIYEYVQ